ncbi:hypothetical protein BKP64_09900 [Marinobacter salinus]|uniref:Molybdenum cofactor biosysynthesis protein n=1 Tax=Marinobacter salinus TaxID=1874317 RepID=A0A1D9GLD9_9GAMM|nr:DUF2703 domain-containing protein [Marinobacter salinus]AOY88452.1 hypothetical protein BKP64_09900 [Marinobacter salinus]
MNTLEIEWRHLEKDGSTCIRCTDTGQALNEVVAKLAEECRPHGWEIKYKETKLTEEDITESNMILFNGVPIESVIPEAKASESHCESCCEITGEPTTSCRTLEIKDQLYEGIPASIVREAICELAQCCK